MKWIYYLGGLVFGMAGAFAQNAPTSFKFDFGPGAAAPGFVQVKPDTVYSRELGYGFEPGGNVEGVDQGGDPLRGDFVTSGNVFRFSVAVPEGNYKVTVTLGDAKGESTTTVKAEARRLIAERVHTDAGNFTTRTFLVNIRNPVLPDGRKIKLDVQEVDPQGNLITPSWDDKLTLQFSDARPCVAAVEIEKANPAVTVFIIGDSTVTDQRFEPYGTWGMMMTRWFKPDVLVANYAESGETLKAFRKENRWDKILGQLKPGDYVFMQFGTNDLNKGTGNNVHNGIWPPDDHEGDWANTYVEGEDYKNLLKQYAAEVKAKGAIPVIVSPMTKIDARSGAINTTGLRNYPQDAMAAAREAGVAAIDLNAMSMAIDTALGPDLDKRAYTAEGLHQTTYGGYLFSRAIVEGIKENKLDLAKYLVDDAGSFDPKNPQPMPDDFKIPLEPRPALGNRRGRGPAPTGAARGAPLAPAPASGVAPTAAESPAPAPARGN